MYKNTKKKPSASWKSTPFTPKDSKLLPTESEEQVTLFSWARMKEEKYPELRLLYHIPNGGSRNQIEAKHLKAQGVKSGVPDLCLPVARGLCTACTSK